jgi:hypothetical protein
MSSRPGAPLQVRRVAGEPRRRAKFQAMTEHQTSRTLLKSPPELWAECSDVTSLARHLDGFGEIRIIRLEPETAVAWEGECASGTVRLEPAGWGTRVTVTASPAPAAAPAAPTAPAAIRRGLLARALGFLGPGGRRTAPAHPEQPEVEHAPTPPQPELLLAALESLGQAHRRPFARS